LYFCPSALIETGEFCTNVIVNGVDRVVVLAVSFNPSRGRVWNVMFTVFGCSVTLVVADRPPASVAVSWSSRNDG
jgi:hypothetical protein